LIGIPNKFKQGCIGWHSYRIVNRKKQERKMNHLILMLTFFIGLCFYAQSQASGTMYLHCSKGVNAQDCYTKTKTTIESLGCNIDVAKTFCTHSLLPDPSKPNTDATIPSGASYCEVNSSNCSQPDTGLFGGESCGDKKKVKMSKKSGVDNGYSMGLLGSNSRVICISK
jgi:hypothetical protein